MAQESDVSGFEVFSDGPARQDYLQAWENEGDAIQVSFIAQPAEVQIPKSGSGGLQS